ncbi:MAG: PBP1A family penicillin-binding protein [Candidatus Andersenbacteria bacterium]
MAQRRFSRQSKFHWRALPLLLGRRGLPLFLTIGGVLFLMGAGTVLWWSKDLPNPQNIDARRVSESTKIFDATGQHLLYEIGDVHRTTVRLDQISRFIRQATLAAEDDQFYEHYGLDLKGILRGGVLKPLTGRRIQGGSTITQQLIKNSILTPERTLRRKVKEAVLALELEQRFSKDEIFEMYLNDIPYGSQAYGIEAAAQAFFDKPASEVSLAQATTLAALPQAPTYYSPYGSHMEDLKQRQELILDRMAGLNMISRAEADAAKKEELVFVPRQESIQAPHFVFYVKEQLDAEYGERVVEQGGLKVITSLNIELQKIAEEVLKERQEQLRQLGASNAALVAIDPKNGNILAMTGSIDYFNEEIDGNVNVSIRHRSPGSSIKPVVYAAAWQAGFTPETILVDVETDFGQGYKPRNYNLSENGPVTMRQALANSLNIPAVQTLYLVGVRQATALAQRLGMTSLSDPDRYGLSLVLGGGEVRLVDEVSAYGVFANDGIRHPHRAILKVENKADVIFEVKDEDSRGEQVLEAQIARLVTNVISDNGARALVFGTNTPLQLGSRPVAAKTGTTQEFRDGWTVGYTPSLVAGVWVGNNDNSPMNNRSDSGLTAAPLWNAFMRRALTGKAIEQFVRPEPSRDIPHGILRGELPEVKGKWEEETQTLYTADCPVAVGQPVTFKELHSILFYINKGRPLGPPPARAESDPQFSRWEGAVAAWRDKHNQKKAEVRYTSSLPTPTCGITSSADLPIVRITEPNTSILKSSPVVVKVEVDSKFPIREVRFLLEGEEIARRRGDEPFETAFSFPGNFTGRKTLLIQAITDNNLIGRGHRTFIINPDDSAPRVTLHTPRNNEKLSPPDFPQTIKVTATDDSGIELVDVLYQKDGQTTTNRIGRTSTTAATAANRYEVIWPDSPGPGTYYIFVIAYDKTGNNTQTEAHTITIE